MTDRIPAEVWPPATFIQEELDARGQTVGEITRGKVGDAAAIRAVLRGDPVTPERAEALARAFGTSVLLWQRLDATWWASLERQLEASEP